MPYIILIEWGNGDKTFESFQFLKDAKKAFENNKSNSQIEHMQLVVIGELATTWSNPDACSE
jgi:hypothetical protein